MKGLKGLKSLNACESKFDQSIRAKKLFRHIMEDRDGFDKNECLFGGGGGLLVDVLFL